MSSTIRTVTIDCAGDPYWVARFWSEVLDRPLADDDKPGDPEALVLGGEGVPTLLFMRVPEDKTGKNRIHLDLHPRAGNRDEEVERVRALGARELEDRREPDGSGWVIFADPEGNEFCVVPSEAEFAALGH